MALIRCSECNRDISDQAAACPGCGAPAGPPEIAITAPGNIEYEDGIYLATRQMMTESIKSAILATGYRLDAVDEIAGTASFTTGMTMGSFSGVSGTISYREIAPYRFEVTGGAKQNVRGGQVVAMNLFGEAQAKLDRVLSNLRVQTTHAGAESPPNTEQDETGMIVGIVVVVAFVVIFFLAIAH